MEHSFFVSTSELHDLISSNSVQIVDSGMNHLEAFTESHIPGSIYFNVSEVRNKTSTLSQEVPTQSEFLEYLRALGFLNTTTPIVVYDQTGFAMAGRAWFLLRHFGVANVRVLDGGLPKWKDEGKPVESGPPNPVVHNEGKFELNEVQDDRLFYYNVNELSANIRNARTDDRIWDPRPPEAFSQGTVDGAVNAPAGIFFNADKTVKSKEEVAELIRTRIGTGRIVTSCFKGNMACLGYLILKYAAHESSTVYSGSLEEWRALHN